MVIHQGLSKENVAEVAAQKISRLIKGFKNSPVLLLLSGGSAFEMYDLIDTTYFSEKVAIAVLDERYNYDDSINNFAQLEKTKLYKRAEDANVELVNTYPTTLETRDELVERFEDALVKWKKKNPNGVVIAVIGIGSDGHVSGIMPVPEDEKKFSTLFERTNWDTGYDTEERISHRDRVTTTITFLKNEIDQSVVYVSDENKKEVLEKVLEKDKPIYEIPGRVINYMKNVELITTAKITERE